VAAATVGRTVRGRTGQHLEGKHVGVRIPLVNSDTVEVERIGGDRIYAAMTGQAASKTRLAHQLARPLRDVLGATKWIRE